MSDINELLDQTLRVARLRIPKQARIETRLGELPLVPCQPQRIKQVLINLILNAAQAIESDGNIRLITERVGNEVLIRVEDDGCGIPDEFIHRIFDPFFTTKEVGQGTGLGLSLAHKSVVDRHGGRLEVSSQAEAGTTFVVTIPTGGKPQ